MNLRAARNPATLTPPSPSSLTAGLDLNPLDVTDPTDFAWLDALIWPEHAHRRARLRAAAALAAAEPPLLVPGDLVDDLPALAARAPADATLVVFHTSVLYQVPPPRREAFAKVVGGLPGHWIASEAPHVLPYDALPTPPDDALRNVLALDGTPLAWTSPHGRRSSGSDSVWCPAGHRRLSRTFSRKILVSRKILGTMMHKSLRQARMYHTNFRLAETGVIRRRGWGG